MAMVLIVDDHPGMASAVAATVRSEGYEVAVVHGGREALEYVRGRPVDLMVLDAMMPDVSGLDVLGELRRRGAAGGPEGVGGEEARGVGGGRAGGVAAEGGGGAAAGGDVFGA